MHTAKRRTIYSRAERPGSGLFGPGEGAYRETVPRPSEGESATSGGQSDGRRHEAQRSFLQLEIARRRMLQSGHYVGEVLSLESQVGLDETRERRGARCDQRRRDTRVVDKVRANYFFRSICSTPIWLHK